MTPVAKIITLGMPSIFQKMSSFDSITTAFKPFSDINDGLGTATALPTSDHMHTVQNNVQPDAVDDNISLRYWSAYRMKKSIVIWLDSDINELDSNYQSCVNQLRQIINSVEVFSDVEQCVDFIVDVEDAKIFLILSDAIEEATMPLIHDAPQLDSIYVFSTNHSKYEQWMLKWKKIVGVFSNILSICDPLQRNIKYCEQDLIPSNIISTNSGADSNEIDPTFMYLQILTDILLEIDYGKSAKKEFIECCRKQYEDNEVQLHRIDVFEREYELHSALWWYIKESFIVSMLANALKTQNVTNIIKMGFYIKDLHKKINEIYAMAKTNTKMVTYRGQIMAKSEVEKLRKNLGCFIAFGSFLSTTTNSVEALIYTERDEIDLQLTGTVFEMKIDPASSKIPFVSLSDIDDIPFCKNEILFSMHTVFRIDAIEQVTDGLWSVELTLTSDTDEQLQRLAERLRKEIEGPNPFHRLGNLLTKIGEFDKAEEIFKTLLETISNVELEQVVSLYSQLGYIYKKKGILLDALFYHQKALENQQKITPPNHSVLANIYNDIGEVHQLSGGNEIALLQYHNALRIHQECFSEDHSLLAIIYNNIGQVYNSIMDYSAALSYFRKILEIQEKILVTHRLHQSIKYNNSIDQSQSSSEAHSVGLTQSQKMSAMQEQNFSVDYSDLATAYNNIGRVYFATGEYSIAHSNYEKALEIQAKSLLSDHSLRLITHNNIGQVYHAMKEYSAALTHYQKVLEIQQKFAPSTHPSLAMTYTNIAETYTALNDYLNAIAYYKKALKIQEVSLPPYHLSLAIILNNIGRTHELRENYPDALNYYEKALKIQETNLSCNDPSIAITYSSIGRMYYSTGDLLSALNYYEKILKIQTQSLSLSLNDSLLAESYYHIARTLQGLQRYNEATEHALRALNLARYSFERNQAQIEKYEQYVDGILLTPECIELSKTIDKTE